MVSELPGCNMCERRCVQLAFAAEKARLDNVVVDITEFENEYRKKIEN
jgi:hypothetical protein